MTNIIWDQAMFCSKCKKRVSANRVGVCLSCRQTLTCPVCTKKYESKNKDWRCAVCRKFKRTVESNEGTSNDDQK